MIVGLQIGKEKSVGRPGKNYMKIMGRQMNEYSLMAAFHCDQIDKIFISTDSPAIKKSAEKTLKSVFKKTLFLYPLCFTKTFEIYNLAKKLIITTATIIHE